MSKTLQTRTTAAARGGAADAAVVRRRGRLHAAVLAGVTALALSLPTGGAQAAGKDWRTPAGSAQGTRYSTLAEITTSNARRLVEEFSFATGSRGSHQGQPLVVGKTLYLVTPFPNRLIALDLENPGAVRWTYTPNVNPYARGVACCDTVNRGAVYADGKIIYNVLDGTTTAVDATTGQLVWRTKLGEPTRGETMTGAPIVVGNKVIVGNSGGELGVRGWVQGLDLDTGRSLWKAWNTGPDSDVKIGADFNAPYPKDRGENLGQTSWPGTLWRQGGSTSWGWFTYDPDLDLLYHGTGNPGVWNPDMREGDNKWGATIFARKPDTGEAVWAYQLTPHDGWDYDAVNESIVANLRIDGKLRKVIVHVNKNGFAYTLDRATGKVLVAEKLGHVTWARRISLRSGKPAVEPEMRTHQGERTEGICPSVFGIKDWEPTAYSAKTKLLYVPAINFCNDYEPLKAEYLAGTPFTGVDLTLKPGPGTHLGELVAWNPATGERAWAVKEALPLYAGALATAGNLVFYGTLDGWFKAVNARTGRVVFKKQLECGIVGNPISYRAPDGKQRIAVVTGIGYLAGGFAGASCPAPASANAEDRELPSQRGALLQGLPRKAAEPQAAAVTSGRLYVFKLP